MDYIKHSAIIFRNKNGLAKKKITFSLLCKTARQNGFIVKDYSSSRCLRILLDIYDKSLRANSVTAKDGNGNIIIFVNEKLPAKERTFVLAHEIGHILLQHSTRENSQYENEADLFAHYLLDYKTSNRFLLASLCVVLAVTLSAGVLFDAIKGDNLYVSESNVESTASFVSKTDICYYTEHGTVYHYYKDCSYIKNSKNVITGTISQCGKSKCCFRCCARKEQIK